MTRDTEKYLAYLNRKRRYIEESLLTCSGYELEGKHFLMLTQEELDAALAQSPALMDFFTRAKEIKEADGDPPPKLPKPYEPNWDRAILGFLREIGVIPKSYRHRRKNAIKTRRRFKKL